MIFSGFSSLSDDISRRQFTRGNGLEVNCNRLQERACAKAWELAPQGELAPKKCSWGFNIGQPIRDPYKSIIQPLHFHDDLIWWDSTSMEQIGTKTRCPFLGFTIHKSKMMVLGSGSCTKEKPQNTDSETEQFVQQILNI
jgi:hypothetical protein